MCVDDVLSFVAWEAGVFCRGEQCVQREGRVLGTRRGRKKAWNEMSYGKGKGYIEFP